MRINPHIFRDYDIRGRVGADLSEEFAYLLGRAFARLLQSEGGTKAVALGHDCRPSSPGYADAAAEGLRDEGSDCILLGMCPTPQLYWLLQKNDWSGGIQVTGSHNGREINGFKLSIGKHSFSGPRLQQLLALMPAVHGAPRGAVRGRLRRIESRQAYIEDLIAISRPHMGARRLKAVVDAGNGVAGLTGPAILRGLGLEVVELNCTPDGTFPQHHPDPVVPAHLAQLSERVLAERADFGIGWDGDGDRIGVVDERGDIIYADLLLLLYARAVTKELAHPLIIGDVKCSSRLFAEVERLGGRALMWRSGHAPMKEKLRESGAALGGELAGHIFFSHRFYGFDDAAHCACRLAEIVSGSRMPLSAMLGDLPPAVATPEIRLACPDEQKFLVVDRLKPLLADLPTATIDGLRVTFAHGWGLVRASNTEPALVLRFEAENGVYLEEYSRLVQAKLAQAKESLAAEGCCTG